MQPTIAHNLETLRALLVQLARWDVEVHRNPEKEAAALAYSFRDCRLELIRLGDTQLSEDQLHRLKQLDYRLQMVVDGHAVSDSISLEAKRTLDSFGWSSNT